MPSTSSSQPAGGSATAPSPAYSAPWHTRPEASPPFTGCPTGRRVLRLTDFVTSNGPDVRVYLVAAPNATDNATVEKVGFVDFGKLKGTSDQREL